MERRILALADRVSFRERESWSPTQTSLEVDAVDGDEVEDMLRKWRREQQHLFESEEEDEIDILDMEPDVDFDRWRQGQ